MPILDGFEATRKMRALEAEHGWPRAKILACTGHDNEEIHTKCLRSGMDEMLIKPINKSTLQKTMFQTTQER